MARTLIGTRIRERRRANKLTQSALAKSVGISASYLNLIEHNRRGIAGRTLLSIARELDLQPSDLTEGADSALINTLTETAKTDPKSTPEVDRIEEFVGRYPGWAKLLSGLAQTTQDQRETITALSDQLSQDPFLSETMHQILSNITAIRSTASILATADDIPTDMRLRFLDNLHKDSQRLSDTAQNMVDFFDRDDMAEPSTPTTTTHDFWAASEYAASETNPPKAPKAGPQSAPVLSDTVKRMRIIENRLPIEQFVTIAKDLKYDPLAISLETKCDVTTILFRMAQMPTDQNFPNFGIIEIDMSGAIIMRKPIRELALPQHSSACPLWPVYRALARPSHILKAILEMPSGDRVLTYSNAEPLQTESYTLPALFRSVMIFSSDNRVMPKLPDSPVRAGLHCSVCPRKNCAARRADYILA